MEPKNASPEFTPHEQPTPIEYSFPSSRPEKKPEQAVERTPEVNQELHQATTSATVANDATTTVALPTPVSPVGDGDTSQSQPLAAPTTAADDDLIEKEWVDKAKKIITETKDDPHAREQLVGKLQVEYLRKRYGKELGMTE